MISAPALLKEHGISSTETRCPEESDYAFQFKITVVTDQETNVVGGTLYGKDDPRICSINGTRMDAEPRGWVVVFSNDDKPLVLGHVTTIIGNAGVNIANMTLGRQSEGGGATTLINLDGPLDEATLTKLRETPHVNQVRMLDL